MVKLLRQKALTAIDIVSGTLCAPLADYAASGAHRVVASRKLGLALQRKLANLLHREQYGQAIVMSRKWKAALAPWIAGILLRTGFAGEFRFGLLNDVRFGESRLPRMIDQMGALALPKNATIPTEWPLPELKIPNQEIDGWLAKYRLADENHPIVTLSPGAVGAGKAWSTQHYAELARALTADKISLWVLGGPNEAFIAKEIAAAGGNRVRDLTSTDLRNAILALAAADASVTNDSGLMHVSAAIGTPTVAIFGPTSPWHWKPLNPLAAVLEPTGNEQSRERARAEGTMRYAIGVPMTFGGTVLTTVLVLASAKNRQNNRERSPTTH